MKMRSYLSTSASPDFPLPKKVTTCIFSFHVWKCRDLCVPLICVTKHVSMFNIGGWYVFTFRLTIFSCFTWFYTNFSLCSYNLCFHSWKDSTNENFGLNHMLITYMYTFKREFLLTFITIYHKIKQMNIYPKKPNSEDVRSNSEFAEDGLVLSPI